MVGSRFDWRQPLKLDRLKDFVALEGLTAQTPLIELPRMSITPIKIWLAYDITRTHGTFVEVWLDGMVKTVTVQPSGKRDEMTVRPPSNSEIKKRRVKK
jgi:hypothetical protein